MARRPLLLLLPLLATTCASQRSRIDALERRVAALEREDEAPPQAASGPARSTEVVADASRDADAQALAAIPEIGVESCDTYIEKYSRCVMTLPAKARSQLIEALSESAAAWKDAANGPVREKLSDACAAAIDSAAKATAPLGCEW
jgi:hypothetical protein